MSDNNTIYEITKVIGDEDTIKNDLHDSVQNFIQSLQDKYVHKLNEAVVSVKSNSEKQLSKEFQLVNALKPFISENYHSQFENALNIMTTLKAAMTIHSDFQQVYPRKGENEMAYHESTNAFEDDSSIHEDGIYEFASAYAKQPSLGNNNMLPLLVVFLLLKDVFKK